MGKQILCHFRSDFVKGKFDGNKDVAENMVNIFVESDCGVWKVEMRFKIDKVWVRIQLRLEASKAFCSEQYLERDFCNDKLSEVNVSNDIVTIDSC
jgi:hypothetical protein